MGTKTYSLVIKFGQGFQGEWAIMRVLYKHIIEPLDSFPFALNTARINSLYGFSSTHENTEEIWLSTWRERDGSHFKFKSFRTFCETSLQALNINVYICSHQCLQEQVPCTFLMYNKCKKYNYAISTCIRNVYIFFALFSIVQWARWGFIIIAYTQSPLGSPCTLSQHRQI